MRIVRFVVALVLLAAGIGATAAPAMAFPPGQIGSATINKTVFVPGETVVVTVQNTKPGPLVMQIFSAPVTIGTGTTGRNGQGTVTGNIPAGYSGAHTIQVTGDGGEIYPFQITVTTGGGGGGGGGGACWVHSGGDPGAIDRHTITGFAATCHGTPGDTARWTFGDGDWFVDYRTTYDATGVASISASTLLTDNDHELPLGTSSVLVIFTGTGVNGGSDSFDVSVAPDNVLTRACPSGTVSGSLNFTGVLNRQGTLYSGTLIQAYQGAVITASDTTSPGSVVFDSATYDVADGIGSITVNVASPTRTADVDEIVAVSPASCTTSATSGLFHALSPDRVLDTRTGNGAPKVKVGAGKSVTVQLTGRGGLPADGVGSVVMNATVTNPTGAGYISVYPAGGTRPVVSSLNFVAGRSVPNAVTVPVGSGGKVSFYNGSGGTVDLVADVSGYFLAGTPTEPGAFASVAPTRILDTRTGNGAPKAKIGTGKTLALQVTGRGGIPATGVASVVMNTTVTNPTGNGYVTAYPTGSTRPVVSSLNFVAGQTAPNAVTVPVGTGGKVGFYNGSGGSIDLLADVSGYYLAGTPTEPGAFVSLTPARVLDTRTGNGAPEAVVARGAGLTVQLTGRGGLPSAGVASVVLNATVTNPTGNGYITVYPAGTTRPVVSSLNFVARQTIPNAVTVPVSTDGEITLYNGSSGTVDLLADVAGYYLATPPPA